MNILVTGGAGFVGSNFIHYIFKKYHGYKIINLDKLVYNLDNLSDIEKDSRYGFIRGDICDEKVIDRLVSRRPDAIVNFANCSSAESREFIRTNILGTQILLAAAKKYQISCYLQVSTNEVFALESNNPYLASKAGADLIVQAYHKTFNLPVLITRCSRNYGPYQHPGKLIPSFIVNLLKGEKITVYGDGSQICDWVYVLDHCSAIDCVLHQGKAGEIYNISANAEKTNLKIAKLILNLLDKDEAFIEYDKNKSDCEKRYSIESTKLRQLGWRPKYMFDEAMSDTIDWYVNNWKEHLGYYKKL